VWVATSGNNTFPLLSAALASISDATASKPYVIRIAPGVYTETSPVALKNNVDVEGSGQGTTTITCACGGDSYNGSSAAVSAGAITAEIRHLTINNTGPSGSDSFGVYTTGVTNGSFSMDNVTATSTGGTFNYGVSNFSSSPSIRNSAIAGTTYSIYNVVTSPSAKVADTVLDGGVVGVGFTCVGVCTTAFTPPWCRLCVVDRAV